MDTNLVATITPSLLPILRPLPHRAQVAQHMQVLSLTSPLIAPSDPISPARSRVGRHKASRSHKATPRVPDHVEQPPTHRNPDQRRLRPSRQ